MKPACSICGETAKVGSIVYPTSEGYFCCKRGSHRARIVYKGFVLLRNRVRYRWDGSVVE